MGRPKSGTTVEDRFWPRVLKGPRCWLWVGYSTNGRYGALKWGGARLGAHIVSYMLANKLASRPAELVLHKCDTPRCVRPDHLYLGSQQDNARDSLRRGTFGRNKITAVQAKWCAGQPAKLIAKKFKVSLNHAQALRAGRYWRGV